MQLSRRSFLGNLGMGATAAAVSLTWSGGVVDTADAAVRELVPTPQILLNSNENPYGPSLRVIGAMREAVVLANRYPDEEVDELTARIAAFHKVSPEQVVRGNGSGEVLRMAAEAFSGPGKKILRASPSFELLGAYARRFGGEVISVPLTRSFAHDLDAMLAKVDANTSLVYICNPNNPTASLTPRPDIEAFLRKLPAHVYILLDEAYHHFADSRDYVSFLDSPVNEPRLVVLRTFSKVYGLAGIRLGYGVGAAEVVKQLARYQLSDNNNMVAACCGATALEDAAGVATAVKRNAADRAEFMKQAAARGLKPIPSHANFIMIDSQRPVRTVIEHFRQNNILIGRPFPPLETYARVSLGVPDEMAEFWRVWDRMPAATAQ